MGLLGCPASFQQLIEGVIWNLQNIIIYINNFLVHSDTHKKHLESLEQVLDRLSQNHLKINLEKCIFGNMEVSYLGFTLTTESIKPRKNKLKAIQQAKAPNDVKTIRSFVGLCNFFLTHIKDFAVIAAPLFILTRWVIYKEAHCPDRLQMGLSIFENNWCPNQWWLFLATQPLVQRPLLEDWGPFSHKLTKTENSTQSCSLPDN